VHYDVGSGHGWGTVDATVVRDGTSWRVSHSLCDGNIVGHLRFECSPRKVALCVVVERDLGEQVRAGDGDKKAPLGLSLLQQRDGVALLGGNVEEEQ
jgi:hypothetical protein